LDWERWYQVGRNRWLGACGSVNDHASGKEQPNRSRRVWKYGALSGGTRGLSSIV
jgi:hypothetical protein